MLAARGYGFISVSDHLAPPGQPGSNGVLHPLHTRRAGVLCHVTSLPGAADGGMLGAAALRFLDFLHAAGIGVWQVLPLNPPDSHGSPYQSPSLSACSTALADWRAVAAAGGLDGWLEPRAARYAAFCDREGAWLDDFAVYSVATRELDPAWWNWPVALRTHAPDAVAAFAREHAAAVREVRARQFVVFEQWRAVHDAARARGILLFGDLPLYPALASADVWANQDLFQLDREGQPVAVAGVPPDYFSATGQLWGNPLYDWDHMTRHGFAWWLKRLAVQLRLFDVVRIDHFRGLEAYWSVPAGATDARGGHWCAAPGEALLARVREAFPGMPLVAEDLGIITPAVDVLRERFGLPGMRVLQFAFSGDPDNPHLPEHYQPHTVVYTGTHDNDTSLGWYRALDDATRGVVDRWLGSTVSMPWRFIERAFGTRANTAIVPLQDFLGLGGEARMNTPGVAAGNWGWRCAADGLTPALARRIRGLVESSGRQPSG